VLPRDSQFRYKEFHSYLHLYSEAGFAPIVDEEFGDLSNEALYSRVRASYAIESPVQLA
jgi:hypothetical protein